MKGKEGRMMLRYASGVALAAMIAVLGTGCAAKVNRDVLSSIKRVGILSITIDKLGTQATDDEVMQSTLNYAARLYADGLSKRPEWKLVPLTYRDNASFRDFLAEPVAKKQPTGNKEATGFAAVLGKLSDEAEAAFSTENLVKKESTHYLGASDMPIVPYKVIENAPATSSSTHTKKGSREVEEDWSGVQKEMRARVGQLATKLNLDGLIVIYLRTTTYSTGGVEVIRDGRANGNVKMAATMALISRDGKVAIDFGMPVIDDFAAGNASMPIYKAEGQRGGKITLGKSSNNFPLDLKDPKGNVQKDLYALTDAALSQFMKKLDKELSGK
jgi:hypothetical protein